jgi:hypothetical protein
MKRSKIFLTVSSFVLAIAGVAATKATTHFATGYYYETTAGNNICSYVGVSTICSTGLTQCVTLNGSTMYATITSQSTRTCKTLLKHTF